MSTRRIESFLLRLVVEDMCGPAMDDWRGRIQHVGSGHERQFERLEDILAFISQQFASQQARPPHSDKAAPEL